MLFPNEMFAVWITAGINEALTDFKSFEFYKKFVKRPKLKNLRPKMRLKLDLPRT